MRYIISLSLLLVAFSASTQPLKQSAPPKKTFTVKISADELKLYELIMEYRKTYNLPRIPLSRALTYVAQQHCLDLQNNIPDTGKCNMHSWSSKGSWSACCYTEDHKNVKGVWLKPSELTNYKGYGYEIAYNITSKATPALALHGWQNSFGHNQLIINAGPWTGKWNAIGIGMLNGFAVVWFGFDKDEEGEPGR